MRSINSAIRITATTKKDLSTATVLRIEYTRPDGVTGFFPGTLADGQRIVYEASDTDIQIPGEWSFKAMAVINSLPVRASKPFTEIFK